VSLRRAVLEAGGGTCALNAERAQVDGTLVLQEAKALGEVNLRSIRVVERLLLRQAELRNPSRTALRLSRAQVTSDVFCTQLTTSGRLRLADAASAARSPSRMPRSPTRRARQWTPRDSRSKSSS
jgi:hypothetical protein